MERHCQNASALATWLEGRDEVKSVIYPGLEATFGHAPIREQMTGFGA